jgi:hypothetical protein
LAEAPAWAVSVCVLQRSCSALREAEGATYITDHMGIPESPAKGSGRVDSSVHTRHCSPRLICGRWVLAQKRPHTNQIFFAGGRARSPRLKEDAYFSFVAKRFS